MSCQRASLLIALQSALVLAGCSTEATPPSSTDETETTTNWSLEELKELAYYEPARGVYVADGDTPFRSQDDLIAFFAGEFQPAALTINTELGAPTLWSDVDRHQLTYCVSKSFGSNYSVVVNAMKFAAGDWEQAADIDFIHVPSEDGACDASNTNVMFDVRPIQGAHYAAAAFFPSWPREFRTVFIEESSFVDFVAGGGTIAGLLRHELGHALGFRHEHTRPEANICFEDNSWAAVTPYDSASVMHYPQCNGTSTYQLLLSDLDKIGAATAYGFPKCIAKCCDGSSVGPFDTLDIGACSAAAEDACSSGSHGIARLVTLGPQVVKEAAAGACGNCEATCCDGTTIGSDRADANQCIFWNGGLCGVGSGGPATIAFNKANVWGTDASACPTMVPTFATCCDGTSIGPSNQFDENVSKLVLGTECKNGGHGSLRWLYMDGALVSEAAPGSCGNCEAYCCDGTIVGAPRPDQNSCIFWNGFACEKFGGGPSEIMYGPDVVWSKGADECPTIHSCTQKCADGFVATGNYFSKDMCVFFSVNDCVKSHQGAVSVTWNGVHAWP